MIEDWVDELCGIWAISDARLGQVKSFKLVGEADFPDAINPSGLDLQPIALTVPGELKPEYSAGGPNLGFYTGVTEFHVSPDLNRGRIPALQPWYGFILRAAAGNIQLNGTVEHFIVTSIQGPMALRYGSEEPHWGFMVEWMVKERIGDLVVSA